MKVLTIETAAPNAYFDLKKVLKNDTSKCYIENGLIRIELDEADDEEYIAVIFNTAVLLLINYVETCGLCKTDKQRSFVLSHFLQNPDFRYSAVMNLYSYFETNDTLKESSYFLFNMRGLKDDIIFLLKTQKKQEEYDLERKNARNSLLKHGKKLKNYKTLSLIEDNQYGFALLSTTNEVINIDSLENDFGVVFKLDENLEIDQYISIFVALTCSILDTKILNVEPAFIEIVDDILSALAALNHEIDVNIFEENND